MIEARGLTKRFGDKLAVDGLTFTVRPGVVTGFLGPNGAGKSTTIRMILGLDVPTAGSVIVNGRPSAEHAAPMREVGALLEARAVHTGRTARNHLLALAATTGIGRRRVEEVIGLVGLEEVARKRAGGFSLGMGQRLGIASALLGDPATVILDEPVNGLDPEGILWIRTLLRDLAAGGRTVFVSSHLMSEMALTAEQLIIVGRGRLIASVSVADLTPRFPAQRAGHGRRPRNPGRARDLKPRARRGIGAEWVVWVAARAPPGQLAAVPCPGRPWRPPGENRDDGGPVRGRDRAGRRAVGRRVRVRRARRTRRTTASSGRAASPGGSAPTWPGRSAGCGRC